MDLFCMVDVQYPFVGEEDGDFIARAAQAALAARQRGDLIFLIEDRHGHSTHEHVSAVLRDYPGLVVLSKGQWDGSLQIEMKLSELKIEPAKITICGAYAEQCVLATLAGLRDRFPRVKLAVLLSACLSAPTGRFTREHWQRQSRLLQLELVD